MTSPFPAIADLQAKWHSLEELDRAHALNKLVRAGVSRRSLAVALNSSASNIRHLLETLQASPEDQRLFREGVISRNELVRRARNSRMHTEAQKREATERKRAKEAATGCRNIMRWLAETNDKSGNAEQIIEEARLQMMMAEQSGGLPLEKAPAGMKLDEIIARSRPKRSPDELVISSYGNWLALWVFYAMPEYVVRWTALDQALSRVSSRFWMRYL